MLSIWIGRAGAGTSRRVLETMGLDIPAFGMVKDDRHRTRALVAPDGREIGIQAIPAVFALIGQIQEETHRFAIEFHRQFSLMAVEVENVIANLVLPPELEPHKPAIADQFPEQLFCRGLLHAQLTGTVNQSGKVISAPIVALFAPLSPWERGWG